MSKNSHWCTLLSTYLLCAVAGADVVVISNESSQPVNGFVDSDSGSKDIAIAPGDCVPTAVFGDVSLSLLDPKLIGKVRARFELRPNAAYRLTKSNGKFEIGRIELGGNEFSLKSGRKRPPKTTVMIPVSIWADDEQPLTRTRWERKFRQRFEQASAVIKRYSHVGFKVSHVGEWKSNNRTRAFRNALLEFIDEVDPNGTLAIGFTSQDSDVEAGGRPRLGGIRQPLDRHILLSETGRSMTEIERVEVLVHELGHFLGSGHSADNVGVMRPQLADGLARGRSFKLKFDPANTLLMSLIGEELRANPINDLQTLSKPTRTRLRQIYGVMATDAPSDPLPVKYLQLLR